MDPIQESVKENERNRKTPKGNSARATIRIKTIMKLERGPVRKYARVCNLNV